MSLILITHDLRLAFSTCDRDLRALCRLAARGRRSDERSRREPFHPYTLGLLLSEPPADRRVPRLIAIRGSVPRPDEVAGRCAFADRCDWAADDCRAGKPPLAERAPGRLTRLHPPREIAAEMRALRGAALEAAVGPGRADRRRSRSCASEALVKTFAGRRGRRCTRSRASRSRSRRARASAWSASRAPARPRSAAAWSAWRRRPAARSTIAGIAAADFAA